VDEIFCHSFNALGKTPKKKVDPCIWAACSLIEYDETWGSGAIARVRDFAEPLGLLRHKPYGAIMTINPAAGVGFKGRPDSPHISFWMAAGFDPGMAVTDVVSIL